MKQLVTDHVLVNGTRIAHGIHGNGEPVILIHGTPSSSLIWRNVLPSLVDAGYRVHVYDLLGFGLSERPWDTNIDTSVTGQVPILEALYDVWNLKYAHVVAHDIGGGVAQHLGIHSPDRLRSLTMIDVVSYDSWPSKRTRQQMQSGLEKLITASPEEHHRHFREWILSAVHYKDRLAASSMDNYLDFISNPIGQASLFQHQVTHYHPKHTASVSDRYPELGKLPVQLIWGANDAWQVVDWAHKLHAAIPGSSLHVLDECGHFAMEDHPEKIVSLLLDFFKQQG